MRRSPTPRIDWKQYFQDFCELHGGFPMTVGERLAFADGWTYAKNDYRGPEWPPPEDPRELWELIRAYWKLRRRAVRFELFRARETHAGIEEAMRARSAPLTTYSQVVDEETGRATVVRAPLSTDEVRHHIEWLEDDLRIADERLKHAELELRLLRMPRGSDEPSAADGAPA